MANKKQKPHFRGLTPNSSTVFAVCPKCNTMLEPDFCERCSKCNTYIDWKGVFGYKEQGDGTNK